MFMPPSIRQLNLPVPHNTTQQPTTRSNIKRFLGTIRTCTGRVDKDDGSNPTCTTFLVEEPCRRAVRDLTTGKTIIAAKNGGKTCAAGASEAGASSLHTTMQATIILCLQAVEANKTMATVEFNDRSNNNNNNNNNGENANHNPYIDNDALERNRNAMDQLAARQDARAEAQALLYPMDVTGLAAPIQHRAPFDFGPRPPAGPFDFGRVRPPAGQAGNAEHDFLMARQYGRAEDMARAGQAVMHEYQALARAPQFPNLDRGAFHFVPPPPDQAIHQEMRNWVNARPARNPNPDPNGTYGLPLFLPLLFSTVSHELSLASLHN